MTINMKGSNLKVTLLVFTLFLFGIWLVVSQIKISGVHFSRKESLVKAIDQQGVFVGDKSKVFTEQPKRIDQEIDYVWDQIYIAGTHRDAGRLVEAAKYYEKAFHGMFSDMENIIPGRSIAADRLIETYEKLGRYDEALAVLKTLENYYKSHGQWKTDLARVHIEEIRSRLLAIKKTK